MSNLRSDRSLYLDLELTCWEGEPPEGMRPEIIQIGVVEVDSLTLDITRKAVYFVRPVRSTVSAFCTELTHITQRQVDKQGRRFREVLESITMRFGVGSKITFSWGDDSTALLNGCIVNGLLYHGFHFVDLGHLFRFTMGHKHGMSLQNALESLGLTFQGRPHNALVDAYNTALLHAEMIRRIRMT